MKKNVPKEIWKAAMGAHMMTVSVHKQQTPWLSHAQRTIPVLETIFLEWWLSCFRPRELLRTPFPKCSYQYSFMVKNLTFLTNKNSAIVPKVVKQVP